jgi:hypothetical protein
LLLPQLASDDLQNVPFCSGERGLQGHALLPAATPSPPQPYFQPSPSTPEPLPGLVGMRSQRFEKSGEKIPKTRRFNFQNENFRPAQKWISIISIVKRGSLLPLLEGKKILFVFFVFFSKKKPSSDAAFLSPACYWYQQKHLQRSLLRKHLSSLLLLFFLVC